MSTLTWLHLSDLHFRKSQEYNESVVLTALLADIDERMRQDGLSPDFIVATGDIAFSGQPAEYVMARSFLDEVLRKTKLGKDRLFIVPGNHDVDRQLISPGARAIGANLTNRDQVNTLLVTPDDRKLVFARFKGYARFINDYMKGYFEFGDNAKYFFVRQITTVDRKRVAVLGLNSAWLCGSDEDKHPGLVIGERQVRSALAEAKDVDLRITLVHHPFDWLREFDQRDSAPMLADRCDYILHGHLHITSAGRLDSPDGSAMTIACGACYETREMPNMYNWVRLDWAKSTGTVYLRRYSDARGGFWAPDTLTYKNVANGQYSFRLRGAQDQTAAPSTSGAAGTGTDLAGASPAPASGYDLQAVRELLGAAFSDEEVVTLAFDRFHAVYDEISGGMSRPEKIRRLVAWCDQYMQLDELVAEIARRNPAQYRRFAPRLKRS